MVHEKSTAVAMSLTFMVMVSLCGGFSILWLEWILFGDQG
jgi:hypothetical protein